MSKRRVRTRSTLTDFYKSCDFVTDLGHMRRNAFSTNAQQSALRKFSVRMRPRVARDLLCGFLMLSALDSIVKRCVRVA
jgi:hypothetical protein